MPALSATETLIALNEKRMSCRELMSETLSQIHKINSSVNAICTLIDEEEALGLAAEADVERELGQNDLGHCMAFPSPSKTPLPLKAFAPR